MTDGQPAVFDSASFIRDSAATGDWTLEDSASRVEFGVKHFWGLVTVRGHFTDLDGAARVAAEGPVTASLNIGAASVDTKNGKRDKHLRSADFFNAEQHSGVEVRIDEIGFTSHRSATARGNMTIAGHTQPVSLDATLTPSGDNRQATVDATFDVDRTTYGMTWSPLHIAASTARITVHLVFRHISN